MQEFNIKKLIIFWDKCWNHLNEIIGVNIKNSQSEGDLKWYQAIFGEYTKNIRKPCKYKYKRTVDYDLNKPSVYQISTRVKELIYHLNEAMGEFLALLGV